ncbi:MAG TPA: fibronectin type III domain-containing protein [Jatrophihabitans sp.]|nr:fibronectin type III domain-containing protein [Jatrophihabitans sp.]
MLAVLIALLVPTAFTATKAHADTHSPIGSFDSLTVTSAGLVRVYGWAADPDVPTSPIKVWFTDNGAYQLSWIASQSRPDVGAAMPAYGSNHGILYDLTLADGPHTVCVNAANVGAGANVQLGCQSVTVHNNPTGTVSTPTVSGNTATVTGTATDPNSTGAVLLRVYRDGAYAGAGWTTPATHAYSVAVPVAEGPHNLCVYAINGGPGVTVSLGCVSVTVRNNPFGAVESVSQTAAGVIVTGWAIDLNTTGAIVVRAYSDGIHMADMFASISRPDIANLYPSEGANHGYSFTLNLTQGTHTICVGASNVSYGVSAAIGCKTITVQNNPIGSMDQAVQVPGGILISGWAVDFNSAATVAVHVYVDGVIRANVPASAVRSDIAARYPSAGANRGYSLTLPITTGSHVVCSYAINIGPGATTLFPCRRVTIVNNPVGAMDYAIQYPSGVQVSGWTVDPDSSGPIWMRAYVDGAFVSGVVANLSRPDLAAALPYNGTNHGFRLTVPMTPGRHLLCLYGLNTGPGLNARLRPCVAVTRLANPVGASAGIARVGYTNTISVAGWAVDPDTLGAVAVHVTVDGVDKGTVTANSPNTSSLPTFPLYGAGHGYSGSITSDSGEHTICVVLKNVGAGVDVRLACTLIVASGDGVPAPSTNMSAWAGSTQVTLSWTAPRSVNAPLTGYLLTRNPGNHTVPVNPGVTSVISYGLTNGVRYTFTLRAANSFGFGSASTISAVPTNIPPQVTPAPVSTSHYVRNLTGNLSTDAAMMRATGAADAAHNPSGHTYLILLQIGGQDEVDHGAVLSATAKFVTYQAVVSAMNAYLDGYATRQQPYAPLTLAIGTNNDMDVSAAAGISWARNVVNPVAAYAAARHPGTVIAGADDMEPGFTASVQASRSWLGGYLSATGARFVFNGSADGCSTGVAGSGCNNGWSMADLQWLAGGAAPTRIVSLPQIYNYAMPQQWKYISLTGTNLGRARINFGGPLTEYTACVQAGNSCGSLSNTVAWSQLWSAIQSTPATRQSQLPNGTDLRIN